MRRPIRNCWNAERELVNDEGKTRYAISTRLMITRNDIVAGLRRVGIAPGDLVFFHTSLRSFGDRIEDGVEGLIDATLEAVQPGGTIAAPTHLGPSPEPFDPARSPVSPGMGVAPQALAARPEGRRSLHPTHSAAAIGAEADWLVEGHEAAGAVGPGSPLDKLRLRPEGKVVLYGVGLNRMTLIHLAESRAPAPYIGVPFREGRPDKALVVKEGKIIEVSLAQNPGCSAGFGAAERPLREAGLIRETQIGAARVWAIAAGAAVDVAIGLVRRDGAFLLAPPDHCYFCRRAHERVRQAKACPT